MNSMLWLSHITDKPVIDILLSVITLVALMLTLAGVLFACVAAVGFVFTLSDKLLYGSARNYECQGVKEFAVSSAICLITAGVLTLAAAFVKFM